MSIQYHPIPSIVFNVREEFRLLQGLSQLLPILYVTRKVCNTAVENVVQAVLSEEQTTQDAHLPTVFS